MDKGLKKLIHIGNIIRKKKNVFYKWFKNQEAE